MPSTTSYQAALDVLRAAHQPLSAQEITDLAMEQGLITSRGKTPTATMTASWYVHARDSGELVKVDTPGNGGAKRGSVRWTVRRD